MKKKFITTALAATAAVFGGLMSSPSGQQLAEQAMTPTDAQAITQQSPSRIATQGQQAAQGKLSHSVRSALGSNPYYLGGGGSLFSSGIGLSPREYGEYLMRTGKDKRNARKRKHCAKAIS